MTLSKKLLKLASENGSVYIRERKVQTVFAVLGMVVLVWALVLVIPAVAGVGEPTTLHNVLPDIHSDLGGQPGDCQVSSGDLPALGTKEARIVNPATGDYDSGNGDGVTFHIDASADGAKADLAITAGDVLITDIIAKGGKKSAHFDYVDDGPGPVTGDNGIHGPTKGNSLDNYFGLSHIAICYDDAAALPSYSLSGTKWHDHDLDGTKDSWEEAESGWTIRIYNDVNGNDVLDSGDTLAATESTNGSGAWSHTFFDTGGDYIVCEEAVAVEWLQSGPGGTVCSDDAGQSETVLDGGYAVTASDGNSASGLNFGNYRTITLLCGVPTDALENNYPTTPEATATLVDVEGCQPKYGVTFEVFDDGTNKRVTLGGDIGDALVELDIRWPSETRVVDSGGNTVINPTLVTLGGSQVPVLPCDPGEPINDNELSNPLTDPVCQRNFTVSGTTTTVQLTEQIDLLIDPPFFR